MYLWTESTSPWFSIMLCVPWSFPCDPGRQAGVGLWQSYCMYHAPNIWRDFIQSNIYIYILKTVSKTIHKQSQGLRHKNSSEVIVTLHEKISTICSRTCLCQMHWYSCAFGWRVTYLLLSHTKWRMHQSKWQYTILNTLSKGGKCSLTVHCHLSRGR